ncbi:MAG: hypothetical protein KDB70_18670 [Mycobacterium sp.]|nr:hypothetical protein [Mycobacterium sp.]
MPGEAQRDPSVSADAAVPALLNPGGYPTAPRTQLGAAGERGGQMEAHRMFDALVLPFQIEPTLTTNWDTGLYKNARATKMGMASPISEAVGDHGFVVGIQVTGIAGADPRIADLSLSNGWLRFPDDAKATASVADMATRAKTVSLPMDLTGKPSATQPVAVPRHPGTAAVTFTTDPRAVHVLAFTARGPYVLTQHAWSTRDGVDAAELVAKTLDEQIPLVDSFVPTAIDALASLPLDPTGMVARTMEPPEDYGRTVEKGSYGPHGGLAQFQYPAPLEPIFTAAGVTTVTLGETVTYKVRDADAATTMASALAAVENPYREYEPSDGVPGMPGSHCRVFGTSTLRDYSCTAAAGDVVFGYSGAQEDQVHQVMSAQYLILEAK